MADLLTEAERLRRENLFPQTPEKFEENRRRIEEIAVATRRLAEDRREASRQHRQDLEDEAAAERERGRQQQAEQDARIARERKEQGLTPGGLKFVPAGPKELIPVPDAGASQLDAQAQGLANVMQGLQESFGQMDTALDGFVSNTAGASEGLQAEMAGFVSDLAGAGDQIDQAIQQVGQTISEAPIVDGFQQVVDELAQSVQGAGLEDIMKGLADSSAQLDTALDGLASAAEGADQALDDIGEVGGEPFALGGFVRGPGTSTSDSILARLSRGEYVIKAAAVEHFGPRFFAALNSLRMPKFSMGGFVGGLSKSFSTMAIPHMVGGGLADFAPAGGGMRPLSLTFDTSRGRRSFSGMLAPTSVAREIEREAIVEGYTRAGVPPSWDR
jgi:hypothetical protein